MNDACSGNWLAYFEWYLTAYFPILLRARPWNYKDDICLIGADGLLTVTGQECFREAIVSAAPFLMDADGHAKHFVREEYNADKVSFGKSLLLLYRHTAEEAYLNAALEIYDALRTYPRVSAGSFWHKDIYPHQVWLDGLYMILPFYCRCEVLLGSNRFEDILQQFAFARKHLFVREKRLYIHAWDESRRESWADSTTGQSPSFWLRAMGWFLMALADCREIIGQESPEAGVLDAILEEAAEGLLPYLDPLSGMFLQLVDRPDLSGNYPETSGSAMAAYAFMKGARLGMLPPPFAQSGAGILTAIDRAFLIREDGGLHLHGICASAGLGAGPDHRSDRDGSAAYYLSEKQIPDNQHGAAACMMAYGEWLRLNGTEN